MGALSTELHIISVTGSTVQTLQQLDYSRYSNYAVQSSPCFEELQLRALMHKKSANVFGKIDFFGVLHYLVVSLVPSLELDWVLLSTELTKVSNVFLVPRFLVTRSNIYHFLGNSDVSAWDDWIILVVPRVTQAMAKGDSLPQRTHCFPTNAGSEKPGNFFYFVFGYKLL